MELQSFILGSAFLTGEVSAFPQLDFSQLFLEPSLLLAFLPLALVDASSNRLFGLEG